MCVQLITRVVNYRVMRCRVRAWGLLIFLLPPPALSSRGSASHLRGQTLQERERTNKSCRAVRRDIVSCKVNHLRGSKKASSPRKNPLPRTPLPASRSLEETFVTSVTFSQQSTVALRGIATSSAPPLFIFLLVRILAFLLRGQSS